MLRVTSLTCSELLSLLVVTMIVVSRQATAEFSGVAAVAVENDGSTDRIGHDSFRLRQFAVHEGARSLKRSQDKTIDARLGGDDWHFVREKNKEKEEGKTKKQKNKAAKRREKLKRRAKREAKKDAKQADRTEKKMLKKLRKEAEKEAVREREKMIDIEAKREREKKAADPKRKDEKEGQRKQKTE